MSSPKRIIDVELLRIGMYLSKLDRPWLETPFLFQGFQIRTDNEIHELQRYCTTVEIDIEQSDASLQAVIGHITKKTNLSGRVPLFSKRLSLLSILFSFIPGP